MSGEHQPGFDFGDFRARSFTRRLPSPPAASQPRRRSRRRLPSVPDVANGHSNDAMQAAIRDRVNESLKLSQLQAQAHESRFQIPIRRDSAIRANLFTVSSKPGSPNTRLRSLLLSRNDIPCTQSSAASKACSSTLVRPPRDPQDTSEPKTAVRRTHLPRFWQHSLTNTQSISLDDMLNSHLPDEGTHIKQLLSDDQKPLVTMDHSLREQLAVLAARQKATIDAESWGWRRRLAKQAMQSMSYSTLRTQSATHAETRTTTSAPTRRHSRPQLAAYKQPSHNSLRERLLRQGPLQSSVGTGTRSDLTTLQPSPPQNLSPTSSRLSSPSLDQPLETVETQGAGLDWLRGPQFKWELSPKHAPYLAHLV
jgi:hypothetical protein